MSTMTVPSPRLIQVLVMPKDITFVRDPISGTNVFATTPALLKRARIDIRQPYLVKSAWGFAFTITGWPYRPRKHKPHG